VSPSDVSVSHVVVEPYLRNSKETSRNRSKKHPNILS